MVRLNLVLLSATLALAACGGGAPAGDDGAAGAEEVRARGGIVLAESPQSAAIFGMPGAVERTGAASALLSISQIAARISAFAAD